MARRKADLPVKVCPVCDRPFAWRRKWARDWEAVRYCSERCRRARRGAEGAVPVDPDVAPQRRGPGPRLA